MSVRQIKQTGAFCEYNTIKPRDTTSLSNTAVKPDYCPSSSLLSPLYLGVLNMAHILWQQRGKEGWKMVGGGYIPTGLHSFFLNRFN